MEKEKCTSCDGTGRRAYHGAFGSSYGDCNFCLGTGDGKIQKDWFETRHEKTKAEILAQAN